MSDKCPCAGMDWIGRDMTKEHHPEYEAKRVRVLGVIITQAMGQMPNHAYSKSRFDNEWMTNFIPWNQPVEGIRLDMATMGNDRPMEVKYYPRKLVARPFSLDEMIKILAERDIAK